MLMQTILTAAGPWTLTPCPLLGVTDAAVVDDDDANDDGDIGDSK